MKKIYLLFILCWLSFSYSYAARSMAITGGGNAGVVICQGATQVVIYSFTGVSGTTTDAITAWTFSTEAAGTAVSGTDITNFQYWASTSATFSAGTATLLATVTAGLGAGAHASGAFATSYTPAASATTYFYITATIPATATIGNTIIVEGYNATATAGSILAYSASVPFTCTTTFTPTGNINASGTFTIKGVPAAISGPSAICSGGTAVTLSDATPGGTWISSSTPVASIVSATRVLTSGIAGTSTITYSTGCGTAATTSIAVANAPGAISGVLSVCSGLTTTLSDAATGGTWSSSIPAVASVGLGTGLVTGGTAGPATITYATGCNAAVTATVTTISFPGAISGNTTVCYGGSTITLSDPVHGGTWSSSATVVASVGPSTGLVTGGIAAGTTTITYSTGCGTGSTITVTAQAPLSPPSSIAGATAFCQGTALALSDATSGGVWSSGNTLVATVNPSGVAGGVTPGTSAISYTIGNSCGNLSSVLTVTVNALPAPAAITGNTTVCGMSTLSDAVSGGVWSSSNISAATVDATGTVTGISAGSTATISYTLTNGCGPVSATIAVTIPALPAPSPITGPATVCAGGTIILNDLAPGGVWSSSNASVATTDAAGNVTGVATGLATITYTITNGCGSGFMATAVNVVSLPNTPVAITGATSVCAGSTIALSDATTGGIWSSNTLSAATISGLGVVSGVAAGSAAISYSITNSCGTVSATFPVTVHVLPVAGTITGAGDVCPGHTITLADDISGGVWSSAIPYYATVSATGTVTGAAQGLANISYTVTNSCGNAAVGVDIEVLPSASAVCDPTGINVVNGTDAGLKVFPNPNAGTFSIEMLAATLDEPVKVVITNILGEKVMEFITITNKTTDIKLDTVSGIYLLSASTSERRYVTKIIIQ